MYRFEVATEALIDAGRHADRHGWVPATSGNFSARLDDGTIAITVSGAHKGRLQREHIMRLDGDGRPVDARRPSAETLLHLQLYRRDAGIGCVLHTHSADATVLSRVAGENLLIEGMEVLKAFPGIDTHLTRVRLPVFGNDQDMERLAGVVAARLDEGMDVPAYLIAGHGLYAWGNSVEAALRHVEALEFLFRCELETRRIRA
ncbi:MAG: methylthioribulose 1-phosphate dehydratase [Gammaproteobacteria bacterium]|jgi:methylthioribulose-1-phosphate dehydratase|nr:methylthioribulose 1-phosphate dehydratase [Gammaproteobacteria bacterium]